MGYLIRGGRAVWVGTENGTDLSHALFGRLCCTVESKQIASLLYHKVVQIGRSLALGREFKHIDPGIVKTETRGDR